jgi:hypothetical protein
MSGIFIIEDHKDLINVGLRTHEQIDATLDILLQANTTFKFSFTLTAALLVNEIAPGVISVNLPVGQSTAGAKSIAGYIDGRFAADGSGWESTVDGTSINIYVPTDPQVRNRYIAADILYDITWVLA